jgi:hypothetical protein
VLLLFWLALKAPGLTDNKSLQMVVAVYNKKYIDYKRVQQVSLNSN